MIRIDEKGEIISLNTKASKVPYLVTVRLLKRCTAKCLMCDFWKNKESGMSFNKAKQIVDECKEVGVKEICFTGGEPTSYEHFFEIINYINEIGLDYSFITNGSLLGKDFVAKIMKSPPKRVYVSIDSPKSEFHDAVRGFPGLLKKAFNGLKEFSKYYNRPKLVINCVISNENYSDVPDLIKLSERKYFDEINLMQIKGMPKWNLSFDQILDYNQNVVPRIIENLDIYGVVLRENGPYIFGDNKEEITESSNAIYSKIFYEKNKCLISQNMLFIETNGDVFPCNNTPYYGSAFCCGNVFEKNLRSILVSEKMNLVRKKMCGSKLCTACDPINRSINESLALQAKKKMNEGVVVRETCN